MKARHNPFRSECVDALPYRAEGFSWDILTTRLHAHQGRGAIIGPEGHGKTTLLLEWKQRFQSQASSTCFVKLEDRQHRLTSDQRKNISGSQHIFLDSAEQLGWWGWQEARKLTTHAKTLIITTHRPGRLPTLMECRSSPQLLAGLIAELTSHPFDADALWDRYRGNIRLALRSLYDHCASTPQPSEAGTTKHQMSTGSLSVCGGV